MATRRPTRSSAADHDGREPGAPPTRAEILACLTEAGVPLMSNDLGERLMVAGDAMDPFQRRLRAMERDGELMPNRKGALLLASKIDLIAGKVQGHRDGFGFFIADTDQPD
ncbi:MAG: ribonuclease R, partial [Burkholderiaceae bacterium]|nr:ribonuclease R [Burkholderiaceae bacterium]